MGRTVVQAQRAASADCVERTSQCGGSIERRPSAAGLSFCCFSRQGVGAPNRAEDVLRKGEVPDTLNYRRQPCHVQLSAH